MLNLRYDAEAEARVLRKEAREEGREEGLEEGRQERDVEMLRNMVGKDMPSSDICDLMGIDNQKFNELMLQL